MQIAQENIVIEKSHAFVEESFGIGDLRIVLGILRDKLYSDPIKALIQEVISNAKDANVEAGNASIPLMITLPTDSNPSFSVEDNGIGISPERMSGIFIQYGASTKRMDSTQSGGFGIGAKSPFAYTDMFTIETTVKMNDRFLTNVYIAYIDESQIGKLSLVSTEFDKKQQTGTKIELQVKPCDFEDFHEKYEAIVKFFKVKPTVLNELDHCEDTLGGILFENDYIIIRSCYNGNLILVNEIPYPLDQNKISIPSSSSDFSFVFKFGTDVKVSANRESVDLSQASINIIQDKIAYAIETFNTFIQSCLDGFDDFKELVFYVNEVLHKSIFKYINSEGIFKFKGKPFKSGIDSEQSALFCHGGEDYDVYKDKSWFPTSKTLLVIDDLLADGKRRKRLEAVDKSLKDHTNLVVLEPYKLIDRYDKNKIPHGYSQSYIDWFIRSYDLLKTFGFVYLSSYKPYRAPRGTGTPRKVAGLKTLGHGNVFIDFVTEIPENHRCITFVMKRQQARLNGSEISKYEFNNLISFIKKWDKNVTFLLAPENKTSMFPSTSIKIEDYLVELKERLTTDQTIIDAYEFHKLPRVDMYLSGMNYSSQRESFFNHPFMSEIKTFNELKLKFEDYDIDEYFEKFTGLTPVNKYESLVNIIVEKVKKLEYFNFSYLPYEVFEKIIDLV